MTEERSHLTYREFGEVDDYYLISGPSLPEEPGSVIADVVLHDGAELPLAFRISDVWLGQSGEAFTSEDIVTFDLAKVEVV